MSSALAGKVAPVVGWLAHESCSVSGEMYVAVSGRVARAFITETKGVYRPDWTIDAVAEQIDAIRDDSERWTFHPVENGFGEHLGRSFELVRQVLGPDESSVCLPARVGLGGPAT